MNARRSMTAPAALCRDYTVDVQNLTGNSVRRSAGILGRGSRLALFCGSIAALGLGAPAGVPAETPEYRVAPAPAWVKPVAPDPEAAVPSGQVSDGVYYLLSDRQTRVEATDEVYYRHFATKALNENGVEQIAHIEIRFDPAYQTLTLNDISIRRGGRRISKLETAAVRVLQREKELEYRVYDGSKTANVFLDDVRVGDVVEYAYTLRGTNAVFGNRSFGWFDLQWNVPLHHMFARLLWPRRRDVHLAHYRTDMKPAIEERDDYREYRWEARRLPALLVEASAPGWYNPYPLVQWSEFGDWAAVVAWARPLYRVPARLTPALQAEVDRIARASRDPGARLLAVLRFVQREIRYLGVEIGAGSYAPSAPDLVLRRRFGDCKDKSLLAITLLRALGIDAHPALVNTRLRRGIKELYPAPDAFNHVLVRAHLGGRDYWIDPTRPPQQGDLARLYQPNYGYALVVDAATRALTQMPAVPASARSRTVQAVFDARTGTDKPVRFTVTSVLEGASAEDMRNTLASENRDELQKKYLNFYARYYPGIAVDRPFTVREDGRANRLTLTEQYVIADFWKRAEARKRREAEIDVPDVAAYLRRPATVVRHAPLALVHPLRLTQRTEVLLPSAWKIEPEHIVVKDPAFEFEREIAYAAAERKLTFVDRLRSRADHVMPADVARYVANLDRANDAIGYALYTPDRSAAPPKTWVERFNWSVAAVAVLLLLLWAWLAARLYRYDPPPRADPPDAKLRGIRGWLILPAIGVVVMPLRVLADIGKTLPSYAADNWAALTTVGAGAYHPLWAPVLLYELAANLALIVFAVLLAVLFFQKRRSAPRVFIAVFAGSVIVQAVDFVLASAIPAAAASVTARDWSELARGVISVLIWGSYFLVSRRVKATFVNARAPRAVAAAPAGVGAGIS